MVKNSANNEGDKIENKIEFGNAIKTLWINNGIMNLLCETTDNYTYIVTKYINIKRYVQ